MSARRAYPSKGPNQLTGGTGAPRAHQLDSGSAQHLEPVHAHDPCTARTLEGQRCERIAGPHAHDQARNPWMRVLLASQERLKLINKSPAHGHKHGGTRRVYQTFFRLTESKISLAIEFIVIYGKLQPN